MEASAERETTQSAVLLCWQRHGEAKIKISADKCVTIVKQSHSTQFLNGKLAALSHTPLTSSISVHRALSHLQQFVEVRNVTFLRLLLGDLRLFEMDVFVVKCLQGDERKSLLAPSVFKVKCAVDIYYHERRRGF